MVSEICLGTMTFGSFADEKESHAMLDRADAAGVDFLDVAEIYPVPPDEKWAGRSETIVGNWLEKRGRRETLFVATKIAGPSGGWFRAAVRGGRTALDRHNVERAIEGSLTRLRTDYIDLYQTHWPDPDLPYEEVMEALDRAIQAGKVRARGLQQRDGVRTHEESLGLAGARGRALPDDPEQLLAAEPPLRGRARERVPAREGEPPAVQPDRGRRAVGEVPGRRVPRGRALLALQRQSDQRQKIMTRRFVNEKTLGATERFAKIAAEAGLAPVTLAVAWTLAHDFVGSTIIGATSVDQLDDSLRAAEVTLSREVLAACDAVTREILYPMG